jgi:hypothetical protein
MATYNLKEIANLYAKKQPKMVDDLTEKTPILERVKWESASHGLWNMAEKLNDITGAQFVNADAALPTIDASSDLVKTDLSVLGGEMEQAQDTVDQFGGAAPYFAKKEPKILKQAGMDTERKLYYDNWMAKAIDDGNTKNAGATTGGVYSIVVMRMEEGVNAGLFDPTGFKQGALLNRELINGGSLYHLRSKTGVLGYGVALKGRFGWQNLSVKTVGAIVNIQYVDGTLNDKLPTALQIDDLIADVHGSPSDTLIMCHPKARNLALAPFKESALQMGVQEKEYNRMIDYWNGIPVITSYNLYEGTESVVS